MEWLTLRSAPQVLARWWPVTAPQGTVVLVHGLGEHSGRYAHVAQALNRAGFAVLAPDLPGHGRSQGRRGHFPSYRGVLDLLEDALALSRRLAGPVPAFLYGHSLGGNLVINYLLRRPQTVGLQGGVASAPWLRLTQPPPRWRVALARSLGRLLPALTQPNGLDPALLSHDPEVVQAYRDDPLVHPRISAGLFLAVHQAGAWALEHADILRLPLLLMHGTADGLTDSHASAAFAQQAGDLCAFRLWEGLYHELHNEPQKEAVLAEVVRWLQAQLAPAGR